WREALVCGPAPGSLSEDEFREGRARHLAEAYSIPFEKSQRELKEQEGALRTFAEHDEIVLWFEHDLFCQVHLIYLLSWFAQREFGDTRLSLICVGEFPGIRGFRGLGELNEAQLAGLFPQRQEVSPDQLNLGVRAWQAYSAADASGLIS